MIWFTALALALENCTQMGVGCSAVPVYFVNGDFQGHIEAVSSEPR